MGINELMIRAESGEQLSTKEQLSLTLSGLPEIDDVERVDFFNATGRTTGDILNTKGTSASCRIYAALVKGGRDVIDAALASRGLRLYGSYVDEAEKNPGLHPNIDRLFGVLNKGDYLEAEVVYRE